MASSERLIYRDLGICKLQLALEASILISAAYLLWMYNYTENDSNPRLL